MRRFVAAWSLAAASLAASLAALPPAGMTIAGMGIAGISIADIGIAVAGDAEESAAPEGGAVFARNCALCHQSDAAGLAGQYPRLAGRVGHISSKPAGRAYLIDVVTYGMVGMVTVDKQSIVGVMPALQLSDADAARVLSYVAGLGNVRSTPFTTAEITAQRALPAKSGAEVRAERQTLQAAKIVE